MSKLRIHVKFGDTKVLVPCGDGSISVSDMVEKAIGKYKKAKKLHDDDRFEVINLYQNKSVVDMDDEVVETFDDKETVSLEYQYYPHDAPSDYIPTTIGSIVDEKAPTVSTHTSNQAPPPPTHHTPVTTPPKSNSYEPHNGINHERPPSHELNPKSSSLSGSGMSISGYSANYSNGQSRSPPLDTHNSNHLSYGVGYNYYGGEMENDPNKLSVRHEFRPEDETHEQRAPLSQELDDQVGDSFTEIDPTNQRSSQISVHSFDATISQPSLGNSQRFTHSPSVEAYDIPIQHNGYQGDVSDQSANHEVLESTMSKGNNSLDSPNINSTTTAFQFSNSQSMDRLNEFSSQPRQMGMAHSQEHSPYRTSSFHHGPKLSQETPTPYGMSHLSHEGFSLQPEHPMVMSQVDSHGMWQKNNPRMYSSMQIPQFSRGSSIPYRPQYEHEYGMNMNRSSVGSSYGEDFRNPYAQPPMFSQPEKMRMQDHEGMKMGMRGHPHQFPPYPDLFGYHRHNYYHGGGGGGGFDEDPSLSQPSYMMYPQYPAYGGRYPNFQSPMGGPGGPHGMGMGRMGGPGSGGGGGGGGRLMNVPSNLSLSQPGGDSRMRNLSFGGSERSSFKPRKQRGGGKKSRNDSTSKDSKFSIDEEREGTEDEDDIKSSPFRRSSRKSMFLDDGSMWGRWQERLDNMDFDDYYGDNDVPEQIGDSSQRTNTPPSDNDAKDEDGSTSDMGHLHIVELLRGEENLGIQLVSYTSKGRDLGVFIGEMDSDGFAAKSGELMLFDRILACNGEDFTGESNKQVEERLREMTSKEPLLRMAVSRGLNLDLENSTEEEDNGDDHTYHHERDVTVRNDGTNPPSSTADYRTDSPEVESKGAVSSATPALVSTSITNTRQLGVKKIIELQRGPKGTFGFGLASRDVATNNDEIPVYVKSITTGGPAFEDGRLKIGDRVIEVNGVSVKGMNQSEVLSLLRNSRDNLQLVISRQQLAMEPQDEYSELSQPTDQGPLPTPIGKNVLVVNIPLDDCGLHGLGVTVYGRYSKKREDVGIYIKSIQPGGAAAKEGSLRINDRLLSVNNQSLVNMSNASALEGMKKGLEQANPGVDCSIRLTIARTAGINRKLSLSMSSFTTQMPALHEEDRGDGGASMTEIGIDCPPETTRIMSQEIDHETLYEEEYNFVSQPSSGSQVSYGKPQEVLDLSVGSFPSSQVPFSNLSKTEYEAKSNEIPSLGKSISLTSSTSRRSDSGQRSDTRQRPDTRQRSETGSSIKNHRRESHEYSTERVSKHSPSPRPLHGIHSDTALSKYLPMRHSSLSPTTTEQVSWLMGDSQSRSSQSRGSSRSPTTSSSRPSSIHSEMSERPSHYGSSRHVSSGTNGPVMHGHNRAGSGSFARKVSPPYDTLERSPTKDRKHVEINDHSPHTLPRLGSGRNVAGKSHATEEDVNSLCSYSSDPELSSDNPFQRDAKHRKSIPKNKKNNQPDLSQFKINNFVPRLEGEGPPSPPLYRTGSDGDLSVHNLHFLPKEMFSNMEVGPNLRMAKSSSLESLQTVMHYTIKADVRGDGLGRGGGGARSSFRQAVDKSGNPLPAVISLTKSPQKRKQPKRSIFGLFTRKTKKSKGSNKKDKNRRSRPESCVDVDTIGDIAKQYGLSEKTIMRMQSHSGKIEGDDDISDEDDQDFDDYEEQDVHSMRNSRAL